MVTKQRLRERRVVGAVVGVLLVVGAASGCTTRPARSQTPTDIPTATTSTAAQPKPAPAKSTVAAPASATPTKTVPAKLPAPAARLEVRVGGQSPADATAAALNAPVVVRAAVGRLQRVVVQAPGALPLPGAMSKDNVTWTSQSPLAPSTGYSVAATAVNADGVAASGSWKFTTLKPAAVLRTSIAPLNGETVGVGMPVVIYFNRRVKDRAAVERRLRVTTKSPLVGSWHWLHDKEIHYRPAKYWPAGESVRVDVDLAGVQAGDGLWGIQNRTIAFTVGESRTSVVDARTHTMTVRASGKVVRRFNVSTGRDKFPTSSGVHVVMSKDAVYYMDSATIGIPRTAPGGYYKRVLWNVRISNSGEFVHAAPWSVGAQGRRNVSHGCVNASVADARWFMQFSRRGDVVDVVGTPRKLRLGNGFADWTVPWDQWVSGSALAG